MALSVRLRAHREPKGAVQVAEVLVVVAEDLVVAVVVVVEVGNVHPKRYLSRDLSRRWQGVAFTNNLAFARPYGARGCNQ